MLQCCKTCYNQPCVLASAINPPYYHWRQRPFPPAGSPLNSWVSFLLGPGTICMNAPSCSAASLWSGVQVTFLPASALCPPQPQQICKLFTLHFPHLESGQSKPGTGPARKNQQIGPQTSAGEERLRLGLEWSIDSLTTTPCFLFPFS